MNSANTPAPARTAQGKRRRRRARPEKDDAGLRLGLRKGRGLVRPCGAVAGSALTLLYGADRTRARAGDSVQFTAWVTNESRRTLRKVRLVPGSFTNEALERRHFTVRPAEQTLWIGRLKPGASAYRSFLYTVREDDVIHGGELISAMNVHGQSWSRRFHDQHDATVSLRL